MTRAALSVDVGGTKTLIGLVNHNGQVTGERTAPTRTGGDDIQRVATLITAAAIQHRPEAIAIGLPEYVDPNGQLTSHEVLTWTTQPADAVRRAFDKVGLEHLPVLIDSDVRLGAQGEATLGAGRGAGSLLYVSLGTGLSTAFLIAGHAWAGARGEAIGFGEFRAPEGNLEQYVSGAGIAARYLSLTGETATARDVSNKANAGEPLARELLEDAGRVLGDAIADLAAVLDPDRIVMGGGWGTADTPLVRTAKARYAARSARRPGAAPLASAALGHRSGLIGGGVAATRALG